MAAKAQDRRVQRTRKLLRDALMELMLEKGYDAVTVQDIIDRANVGRSTFYAHFVDKQQLLLSGVEQLRESLAQEPRVALAAQGRPGAPMLGFSLPMFQHAQSNYRLYQALVVKGGSAMVEQFARSMLTGLVHDELAALVPPGASLPIPLDVVILYTVSAFMALLKWWLDQKMPCSAEEVDQMFRALTMPGITALGL